MRYRAALFKEGLKPSDDARQAVQVIVQRLAVPGKTAMSPPHHSSLPLRLQHDADLGGFGVRPVRKPGEREHSWWVDFEELAFHNEGATPHAPPLAEPLSPDAQIESPCRAPVLRCVSPPSHQLFRVGQGSKDALRA